MMLAIGAPQIILILLVLVCLIFPIIALVDIISSNFKGVNDKLIWILVVLLLTPLLGALIYFFVGRKQKVDRKMGKEIDESELMETYTRDL